MAFILVDTDIVSFDFKKDSRARRYWHQTFGKKLLISFMTLAELDYWAERYNWGALKREALERHLSDYVVHYADRSLCQMWAAVTDRANRRGRPLDKADAWIAATALELDIPLVTHNANHFKAVDGLNVITAP
jgi:predicted nucleic acid-binding protein